MARVVLLLIAIAVYLGVMSWLLGEVGFALVYYASLGLSAVWGA